MSVMTQFVSATLARVPLVDVVPPVKPDSTGMPGAAAIQTILSWVMSLALAGCVLGGITAAGMVGFGHVLARPHTAERGKIGVIAAIIGAIIAGSAVHLVNTGFGMAK